MWLVVTAFKRVQLHYFTIISTGNTAAFHIIQPSTDNYVQIVSPTTTKIILKCSLNVTIPLFVTWLHNGTSEGSTRLLSGSTTIHRINNFQPSDVGDYVCVFNDVLGSGWELRRNIKVDGKLIYAALASWGAI